MTNQSQPLTRPVAQRPPVGTARVAAAATCAALMVLAPALISLREASR
jgi:hypothetical protein